MPKPETTDTPAEPTAAATDAADKPETTDTPAEPERPPAELAYTGDDSGAAHVDGIPARDLTAPDIDRLVYKRTIPEAGSPGLRDGDKGYTPARRELVTSLLDSGHYKEA